MDNGIEDFEWSPSRVVKLRKLWGTGLTAIEMAERLRCPSKSAVIGKGHRLGLPPLGRPVTPVAVGFDWTEARLVILRRGYTRESAMQIVDMAAAIGCSRTTLRRKADELGLKHPFPNGNYLRDASQKVVALKKKPARAARSHDRRDQQRALDSLNLPLAALGPTSCRFPTTPNQAKPWEHVFCGCKVAIQPGEGRPWPYCAYHAALVRRPMYQHGAKPVAESEAA